MSSTLDSITDIIVATTNCGKRVYFNKNRYRGWLVSTQIKPQYNPWVYKYMLYRKVFHNGLVFYNVYFELIHPTSVFGIMNLFGDGCKPYVRVTKPIDAINSILKAKDSIGVPIEYGIRIKNKPFKTTPRVRLPPPKDLEKLDSPLG